MIFNEQFIIDADISLQYILDNNYYTDGLVNILKDIRPTYTEHIRYIEDVEDVEDVEDNEGEAKTLRLDKFDYLLCSRLVLVAALLVRANNLFEDDSNCPILKYKINGIALSDAREIITSQVALACLFAFTARASQKMEEGSLGKKMAVGFFALGVIALPVTMITMSAGLAAGCGALLIFSILAKVSEYLFNDIKNFNLNITDNRGVEQADCNFTLFKHHYSLKQNSKLKAAIKFLDEVKSDDKSFKQPFSEGNTSFLY